MLSPFFFLSSVKRFENINQSMFASSQFTNRVLYRSGQTNDNTIITTTQSFWKNIPLTLFERVVCERVLETE